MILKNQTDIYCKYFKSCFFKISNLQSSSNLLGKAISIFILKCMKYISEQKDFFFQNAAKILKKYSWGNSLFIETEIECGFSKNYTKLLFSSGVNQLIEEFVDWQNQQMFFELSKIDKPQKIRDQIAIALEFNIIDSLDKTANLNHYSYLLISHNIFFINKVIYKICDAIWKYAGDRSVNFNYYSKRFLLHSVYYSVQTYYMSDNSNNHINTRNFILKSLNQVTKIGKTVNKFCNYN